MMKNNHIKGFLVLILILLACGLLLGGSWTGVVANSYSATTTVAMNSNKAVTANFTTSGFAGGGGRGGSGAVIMATPTVTPRPTVTPMPSTAPAPTLTLVLTPTPIASPVTTLLDLSSVTDMRGVLQKEAEAQLTHNNGVVQITVAQGTAALTAEGEVLRAITLQPAPTPLEEYPIIGLVYDFGPYGANFDPPITIALHYDPAMCPKGVAEENLTIAYFDVATGRWVECECKVDVANHIITTHVSHLALFAIVGGGAESSSAPTHTDWSLIGGIIGGVLVVLGLGTYLLVIRKRVTPSET